MTMIDDRSTGVDHADGEPWVEVCRVDDLVAGRGVCALVDGRQVAIFLLHDGSLHALDNRDPFSDANVLSRGLTGTAGDTPTVASPVYKQRFDLRTGTCIDDSSVRVPVHPVRAVDGIVSVRAG
ncbi:MAG: nitrite reductase small subunit NirD [Actinobacteria bacterium]|nr:nitrite reductase small subunit NirD [Actinomycetota bacterium]